MKRTTVGIIVAMVILGTPFVAKSGTVWTGNIGVDKVYPSSEGIINIYPDGGVPSECNSVFRVEHSHPNKKELFAIFLTALSTNKLVKIRYNNDTDMCWVHSAYID